METDFKYLQESIEKMDIKWIPKDSQNMQTIPQGRTASTEDLQSKVFLDV